MMSMPKTLHTQQGYLVLPILHVSCENRVREVAPTTGFHFENPNIRKTKEPRSFILQIALTFRNR